MMTGAMLAASSGGVWSKGGTRPLPAGISRIFSREDMICDPKATQFEDAIGQSCMHVKTQCNIKSQGHTPTTLRCAVCSRLQLHASHILIAFAQTRCCMPQCHAKQASCPSNGSVLVSVVYLDTWEDHQEFQSKVRQLKHDAAALSAPLLLPAVQPVGDQAPAEAD